MRKIFTDDGPTKKMFDDSRVLDILGADEVVDLTNHHPSLVLLNIHGRIEYFGTGCDPYYDLEDIP